MLEGLNDLISKKQREVRAAEEILTQKKLVLGELMARKARYTDPTAGSGDGVCVPNAGAAPVPTTVAAAVDAGADVDASASGEDFGPDELWFPYTATGAPSSSPAQDAAAAASTPASAAGDTRDPDASQAASATSSSPVQDAGVAIGGEAGVQHTEFDKGKFFQWCIWSQLLFYTRFSFKHV